MQFFPYTVFQIYDDDDDDDDADNVYFRNDFLYKDISANYKLVNESYNAIHPPLIYKGTRLKIIREMPQSTQWAASGS